MVEALIGAGITLGLAGIAGAYKLGRDRGGNSKFMPRELCQQIHKQEDERWELIRKSLKDIKESQGEIWRYLNEKAREGRG